MHDSTSDCASRNLDAHKKCLNLEPVQVNAEMARGIELLDDQKAAGQLTGHPLCQASGVELPCRVLFFGVGTLCRQ